MPQSSEPLLRIAACVKGAASRERVIVRRADSPHYLCLTHPELAAVEELATHPVPVGEFLGRYLGGHKDLDFKTAVSLLVRLHRESFVVDYGGDLQARLHETLGKGTNGGPARRVLGSLTQALDLSLVSFERASVQAAFRVAGQLLVSLPALVCYVVLLLGLAVYSETVLLPDPAIFTTDLAAPEALLLKAFLAFSLAASWTACLQMAALAGAGARFVGASLRLTGFCVVRLAVDDTDAFMLPQGARLRYQLFTLVSPWLSALLAWQLTSVPALASLASLLAGVFALLGLALLCPLWRSPLVKIGEGYLATFGLLRRANAYLTSGLLRGLLKSDGGIKNRGAGPRHGEHAVQAWMTFFACVSIVWLYGMSLTFVDALLATVAGLWVQATHLRLPVRALAAAVLLAAMALAVLLPLLRLVLIPFQNLAAIAAMPLRRARRGIGAFYDKSLPPSAAVTLFLKEIPILVDLTDAQLAQLTTQLKYRHYGRRQRIITRGETGSEFFILADGEAEVVLGGGHEPEEVADHLSPGDSFGEIALIGKVRRTATIRALTPCKVLVLEKDTFDRLFPEDSQARGRLTSTIRQVKLVLESQALSHLAPRQIRELLRYCQPLQLKAGEVLIEENTEGDSAYLIEAGEVQVNHAGTLVATLGRGELVGAIALIKDVHRTASVRALTDVRVLAIDKPTFLRMCMANVFVALLVDDLAGRQLAQTQRQAG